MRCLVWHKVTNIGLFMQFYAFIPPERWVQLLGTDIYGIDLFSPALQCIVRKSTCTTANI